MKLFWVTVFCLIIFCQSLTIAQERYLPPQDLRQETFLAEPPTLRKGYLRIETGMSMYNGNRSFDDKGKLNQMANIRSVFSQTYGLGIRYGISDRFQLLAYLPSKYESIESADRFVVPASNESYTAASKHLAYGIGDIKAEAGFQIIPQIARDYSLTTYFTIQFPTGRKNPLNGNDYLNYSQPVGNGNYEYSFDLTYSHILYPFRFKCATSYSIYSKSKSKIYQYYTGIYSETEQEVKEPGYFFSMLTCGYMINDWIGVNNDLIHSRSNLEVFDNLESQTIPVYIFTYSIGLNMQLKRFRLFETFSMPIAGRSFEAVKSINFGMQYTL